MIQIEKGRARAGDTRRGRDRARDIETASERERDKQAQKERWVERYIKKKEKESSTEEEAEGYTRETMGEARRSLAWRYAPSDRL